MKVLIIGCNGFIGKELFLYLQRKGIEIYGATHSKQNNNEKIFYLDVDNITLPKDFTHIIYLAHFNNDKIIDYYKKLIKYFKNVKYQYYLSSYSAHENAISNYGKLKYQIEQLFLKNNYFIISPGLVIGKGGVFYKIVKIVERIPIIFYPKIKKGLIPIISINSLNKVLIDMLKNPYLYKNKVIVYSQKVPFENILNEISLLINKKRLFIPFDAFNMLQLLYILDRFKFPISSDNLKGFIANQSINIKNDIELFGIKENLENCLKDSLCNL